ncbi:MAG: 2OG-Fe(II) oxygenase [Gammaproteobacteria bacterium]|nr:2OG-Fe(II) oxygenase [Gammaproteobacteria bacterium]
MDQTLAHVIDLDRHPLADDGFRARCRSHLERHGSLVLPGFLTARSLDAVRREGLEKQHLAYYCKQRHNVYLTAPDPGFPVDHPRNRLVNSSKGCITDDQVSADSPLRVLYDAPDFRSFLCAVLDQEAMHPYADPLSSVNIHYAREGQELGWHFDNSSFAITLMIQEPERGGAFEYVRGLRDSANDDMNFDGVRRVLDGEVRPSVLEMTAGTLVLFRGRDSMHRVTPVAGTGTRMLVVLAYNSKPGIELSEPARMTFYGRLG